MLGLIFTWAMTIGGAAAAFFRPHVSLLVYVSFAILKPESLWWWSVAPWHYSRVVGIALLVGWALHGFGHWEFGRARGIVYALLLYGFWIVMCALMATDEEKGWIFVEKQAKIILPFVAGITLLNSVERLKQLAWVLVLSQGYLALWFHQVLWREAERHGLDVFTFSGLDNNSIAIGMCTCVGLAFFLGLHSARWWQMGICFLCAALMAHTVLFMFSRGGMLALVITGVVSLLLVPREPRHYLYFLVAILVGLSLAGKEVRQRFFSAFADEKERDAASSIRLQQWGYCLDAVQAHPLFGVGPDYWPEAKKFNKGGGEAHSLWLHVAAELGIPGILFLTTFYGLCVWRLFPLTQAREIVGDPWLYGAARMVIASLVGFAVSAQFVSLKDLEQPFYVTLIGAGVLRVLSQQLAERSYAWPGNGYRSEVG